MTAAINIKNNNYVLIDRFKRNSYIKLKFRKEENQLYFAGVLEKYSIPYSGGIVYDPDIIMLSTVHYLQIRELVQCHRTKLWGDFSILGFCSIDYINNVEVPFMLEGKLNRYKALQNYIICDKGEDSYWIDLSKGKSKHILRKGGTGSEKYVDQILPEHSFEDLPFFILSDLLKFDVLYDKFSEIIHKKYAWYN